MQFNLREQTSVIVGPSGVGKSSLINAMRSNKRVLGVAEEENWFDPVSFFLFYCQLSHLLQILEPFLSFFQLFSLQLHIQILGSNWFEEQRVGEVSTRSGRGKHTTRHVSLLPLSGGGYLADTPGFNQPSLMKVTKQSLAQYFPEVSSDLCTKFVLGVENTRG